MFIYLASSRKNQKAVQDLGKILRNIGHEVYVFCDENETANKLGSILSKSQATKQWTQKDAITNDIAMKVYACDIAQLIKADAVLMLMPCGYSAHLEAGFMVGRKFFAENPNQYSVVAYGVLVPGIWDAMYGMFDQVFGIDETEKMIAYFVDIKRKEDKNAGLAGEEQSTKTEE